MTAGQPNWQKLHDIGKLPDHARKFIPGLVMLDSLRGKLCENCQEVFDDHTKSKPPEVKKPEFKCDECDFVATARIALISHKRTHGDQNEAKE